MPPTHYVVRLASPDVSSMLESMERELFDAVAVAGSPDGHRQSPDVSLQERLARSEERYRTLVAATAQLVWNTDADGLVDGVPGWRALTGQSLEQVRGAGWIDAVHPDDRLPAATAWAEAVHARTHFSFDYRVRGRDGQYRWYAGRGVPLLDAVGNVHEWVGTTTDIDDSKRADADLRERVRQAELGAAVGAALTGTGSLREALQRCTQAVVEALEGAFARVWTLNEAEQILELQASAGLYTHTDGLHGRVAVGAFKIGRIAELRTPHLTNAVVDDPQVSDKDWARREGMVAFAGYPLLVGDRLVGVLGMFARRPLTSATIAALGSVASTIGLGIARAWSAAEVEAERDRLRQVLDVLPEGVVLADAQARLLLANAAAAEILGADADVGPPARDEREATDRYHTRHPDGTPLGPREGLLHRSVFGGEVVRAEQLLVRRGGTGDDVPLLASSAPLRDDAGAIIGGVMTFQDISDLKALEHQKDIFVAAISHDLKNPLTSILGTSQLLTRRAGRLDGAEAERLVAGLTTITLTARQMSAQIGELVDVNWLQMARSLDLDLQPVDLVALIEQVAQQYRQATERHTLLFQTAIPALACLCDAPRIERVLANLLSNAIKYSPKGGTIGIRLDPPDGGWVDLHVSDQGVGIPDEELSRIFERFYRASNVVGRIAGTGLGLAGVRQIVEQHGGTVALTSAPGAGTTVTLRLPLAP